MTLSNLETNLQQIHNVEINLNKFKTTMNCVKMVSKLTSFQMLEVEHFNTNMSVLCFEFETQYNLL